MSDTATNRLPCRKCSATGFVLLGRGSRPYTCNACRGKGYRTQEDFACTARLVKSATRPLARRYRL